MSLGPGLKNVLCLGACVLAVGAVSVHVAEPGEVANAHAAAGSGEPGVIAAAAIAPSPARAPTRGVARRLQGSESDPEESVPTPFPTNDDDWWGKHSKKATKKAVGQIALILIVVSCAKLKTVRIDAATTTCHTGWFVGCHGCYAPSGRSTLWPRRQCDLAVSGPGHTVSIFTQVVSLIFCCMVIIVVACVGGGAAAARERRASPRELHASPRELHASPRCRRDHPLRTGITLCCISAQKNQQQPNPSATHEGTVVVEPPQPVVGTIVEQQPVVGTIVEPYANKA